MCAVEPEDVRSRADLAKFILQLRDDLVSNPDSWENPDLERYLEALGAWTADMDGWFANRGDNEPAQPSWSLVAHMLYAAVIYE